MMREVFEKIQGLSEDPTTCAAVISSDSHLKDQLQRELDAKAEGENRNYP